MKRLTVALLLAATMLAAAPVASTADVPTCLGFPATIVGTDGNDEINGTNGPDVIVGLAGDDTIYSQNGDDLVCGGLGDDILVGGSGDDMVSGGRGDDMLFGHGGADSIVGGLGRDTIEGGSGDDVIDGGPGRDTLGGNSDNDTILGGSGADVIRGDYEDGSGAGDELIRGGRGADTIWAGPGDDTVYGNRGIDSVYGEAGHDTLFGGPHNDLLVGGAGTDSAVGDGGLDDCSAETVDCENSIPWVGRVTIARDDGLVGLSGRVHHTEPLKSIRFTMKASPSGLWVQPDGSLGPDKVWLATTLYTVTPTDTDWAVSILVPRGKYLLSVHAKDTDGDIGRLQPKPFFGVRVTGLEVGVIVGGDMFSFNELQPLPNGTVLGRSPRDSRGNAVPSDGTGPTVRLSGAKHDGTYFILSVEIAVKDAASGLWLQADGSFAPTQARHLAYCPQCDEDPSIYWLFDVELDDGDYELQAFGFDWSADLVAELQWEFTVDGAVEEPPQGTYDQSPGVQFTSQPIQFTGTATDNRGVTRVTVSIRDRDTGLWLQLYYVEPTWEPQRANVNADLASPNELATTWAYELELAPGRYDLAVAVFDEVLHRRSISPWLPFEVLAP